jgi:hypothetical protein
VRPIPVDDANDAHKLVENFFAHGTTIPSTVPSRAERRASSNAFNRARSPKAGTLDEYCADAEVSAAAS